MVCLLKDYETLWCKRGIFEALSSGRRSEFERVKISYRAGEGRGLRTGECTMLFCTGIQYNVFVPNSSE